MTVAMSVRHRNHEVAAAMGSDELDLSARAVFNPARARKTPSEPLMMPRTAAAVAATGRFGAPMGGNAPYGDGACP